MKRLSQETVVAMHSESQNIASSEKQKRLAAFRQLTK